MFVRGTACILVALAILVVSNAFTSMTGMRLNPVARASRRAASVEETETKSGEKQLTQKEYLIAVRNRLFAVEEQIWLHEYALARPQQDKVAPFSDSKYDALLRARGDLMDEYPATKLYTDLREAQQRNMTYAAM
jgi:hypothetical protein